MLQEQGSCQQKSVGWTEWVIGKMGVRTAGAGGGCCSPSQAGLKRQHRYGHAIQEAPVSRIRKVPKTGAFVPQAKGQRALIQSLRRNCRRCSPWPLRASTEPVLQCKAQL